MTTFYQKISVEKEKPKETDFYNVYMNNESKRASSAFCVKTEKRFYTGSSRLRTTKPMYWLKPCPVEEWTVEYTRWLHTEDYHHCHITHGEWRLGYRSFTNKDLVTEFLKTKNYIQK